MSIGTADTAYFERVYAGSLSQEQTIFNNLTDHVALAKFIQAYGSGAVK